MNIFSSITSLPQETITYNLHNSRRLLLNSPSPTSQVVPGSGSGSGSSSSSSHTTSGFDANIIMILAVLVCALVCSLCINTFIRCVIKCSSLITGQPTYYLNMINHEKKKACGLDKRALKTFPVVKYSKELNIQRSSSECVICLSEFKGGEKVRILPICNHEFHAKCIDKWLSSHTSCPTCRQSLVETCNKILGCGGDHQQASSSPPPPPPSSPPQPQSPPPPPSTLEVVTVSIVPLEREDLVRNYRGEVAES